MKNPPAPRLSSSPGEIAVSNFTSWTWNFHETDSRLAADAAFPFTFLEKESHIFHIFTTLSKNEIFLSKLQQANAF